MMQRKAKSKSTALFLFLLFVLSDLISHRAAFGQSEQPMDGSTWQEMNKSLKLGYVTGFLDASAWAYTNVDGELFVLKSLSEKDRKMLVHAKDVWDYSGISYGQLVEGMDAFYGDYANKAIKWDRAISYTRDVIQGSPKDFLQRELEFERKLATANGKNK